MRLLYDITIEKFGYPLEIFARMWYNYNIEKAVKESSRSALVFARECAVGASA